MTAYKMIGSGGTHMTTYKVTGNTAFAGHQPGDTFDADLTDDEEDLALERGAIQVEGGRSTKTTKKEKEDA
jgi:hypothetical protein